MFHPYHHAATGLATISHIKDKARIAHGKASELGCRHTRPAQKLLNFPKQQGDPPVGFSPSVNGESL